MSMVTLTMNPSVDVSTSVDHVRIEVKLRCDRPTTAAGGGGINVSRAVKELGADSIACFPAGGETGGQLVRLVESAGLRYEAVEVDGHTRQNVAVEETSSDRQYRFVMPGPEFSRADWQCCLQRAERVSEKADYLIASGSLPPGVPTDFYARLVHAVGRHGTRVVVDTNGEALSEAVESGVFMVKPNMAELEDLTGRPVESDDDMQEAVERLCQATRCELVVVSLGAAGSLVVHGGTSQHLAAPTVPIRSKVGAGDSMVAGIVTALSRGWTVVDAVRFGVAAGAAAVMTPGSELCRRQDTERLYRRISESEEEHVQDHVAK